MKQLIITTGDIDGIGQEITLKALKEIHPKSDFRFIVYTSKKNRWPSRIGDFHTRIITSEVERLSLSRTDKNTLTICPLNGSPHAWVKIAIQRAIEHSQNGVALVNGPMSKNPSGWGHTEILKDELKIKDLYMAFIGKKFNACLATTHIPISKVYSNLKVQQIKKVFQATLRLHEIAGSKNSKIRVLGLNPHSGERGRISQQDQLIKKLLPRNVKTLEVPDAAFVNIEKGDSFLTWYHDQALIPFKALHGLHNGIQVTLGLPFIRTSVDHGTAKDIFGQGIADHRPMLLAINKAIQLVRKHNNTLF